MIVRTMEEAQAHLREIVAALQPGEEVVLIENDQELAKLVKTTRTSWPCKAGSARDKAFWMAPDFDAPLDDFEEYRE